MREAIDLLLFVVLPYVAVAMCAIGSIERYGRHSASVSSQSSQFLENRRHFWALMPFHLGLLVVLVAHALWFAAPRAVLAWNRAPARLYAGEVVVLTSALLTLFGLAGAGLRRGRDRRLRLVTSVWDWVVYALLAAQIAIGIAAAVRYTWGSAWFAAVAAPYLWSLIRLNPDMSAVAALPLLARAHIVAAYVLIAIFPYSRLVHILAVPNPYLWRPPQLVRWLPNREAVTGGRP